MAVLLPTYNGARYIEPQIRSLKENNTPFTLHWLDDHSTDNTREVVRVCAKRAGIDLMEWHQPQHEGFPGTFFQLMECVEADIYLFCDQDDIWQPGKIDATVINLLPDLRVPTLCFSPALMFTGDEPRNLRNLWTDVLGIDIRVAIRESKTFAFLPAQGNTMGFTRPLRNIYLLHKDVARAYALSHDWWMYQIGTASGTSRMLSNSPTTLYRLHTSNTAGFYITWFRGTNSQRWRLQQVSRHWISRHAAGFCRAAGTLPQGPKLSRLLALAQPLSNIERRQSVLSLARLAFRGALPPDIASATWLVAACLVSDASKYLASGS